MIREHILSFIAIIIALISIGFNAYILLKEYKHHGKFKRRLLTSVKEFEKICNTKVKK